MLTNKTLNKAYFCKNNFVFFVSVVVSLVSVGCSLNALVFHSGSKTTKLRHSVGFTVGGEIPFGGNNSSKTHRKFEDPIYGDVVVPRSPELGPNSSDEPSDSSNIGVALNSGLIYLFGAENIKLLTTLVYRFGPRLDGEKTTGWNENPWDRYYTAGFFFKHTIEPALGIRMRFHGPLFTTLQASLPITDLEWYKEHSVQRNKEEGTVVEEKVKHWTPGIGLKLMLEIGYIEYTRRSGKSGVDAIGISIDTKMYWLDVLGDTIRASYLSCALVYSFY